jgi:UDP-N-acetyl-D-mannosaminuronate dehydrogenase
MDNSPEVVMIGLGYIGLPTAALIAQNKTYVHGVDINPGVVDTINKGEILIVEPNIKEHKVFKLTDYKEAVEMADIIVFLVAHDEFKRINISKDQEMLNFCGVNK